MSMAGGDEATSASRHRDRQLRVWHRHVRATVAMELATALHHSAQRPKSTVVERPSEGEVHDTYDALRKQKALLLGTRLAPLSEVAAPQKSTVARCPVDGGQTLAMPSFFTAQVLETKRKGEQEVEAELDVLMSIP